MLLLPTERIASCILRGCGLSRYFGGGQILDRNLGGTRSLSRHPANTRALQSRLFRSLEDSGGVVNSCQKVTLYLVG
jgi:hypothetical protein